MKFQYSSYVNIVYLNANVYADSETSILIVQSIVYTYIITIYF